MHKHLIFMIWLSIQELWKVALLFRVMQQRGVDTERFDKIFNYLSIVGILNNKLRILNKCQVQVHIKILKNHLVENTVWIIK